MELIKPESKSFFSNNGNAIIRNCGFCLHFVLMCLVMSMFSCGGHNNQFNPNNSSNTDDPTNPNNPTSSINTCFYIEALEPSVNITTYLGSRRYRDDEDCYGEIRLEYSYDGKNWNRYEFGKTVLDLATKGNKVYFKAPHSFPNKYGFDGNYVFREDRANYYEDQYKNRQNRFIINGEAKLGGNIMSLIDENYLGKTDIVIPQASFVCLFSDCDIVDASSLILPATTLDRYCYQCMFNNCKKLIKTPKLPATSLAWGCYDGMFQGCSSLTTAPDLPAIILADGCYEYMFEGCTSLTTVFELPATTLDTLCYAYMFNNCTSLSTAPELPATSLAYGCYRNMFHNCTSLSTAPELPATTLAKYCYEYMFLGCTSLTTAPELPATILADYCYHVMFADCSSLTAAPELPATILAEYCYSGMFSGCSLLTVAPKLPSQSLKGHCYEYMFQGCSSLNEIEVSFDLWTGGWGATTCWLLNVSPIGTFICPSALRELRGADYIPEGWTIQHK